jgi:hypothetical protein
MLSYFIRIATLISQAFNTIFLLGIPDMTVSARCYLNKDKPYWRVAYKYINKVFFWQKNHCKESFDADIKYAQEVMRYVERDS